MLTSSTSSGLTGDSTSLSATVDLEIVEEIFARGRNATSFPQIFRPYTEILQEHGISPTGDSAYYNFLLKVGVVKAPTWGDKWSLWKANHSPYSSQPQLSLNNGDIKTHPASLFSPPTTHARTSADHNRQVDDEPSSIDQQYSQSRSYHSSLAEVKSRVPFLASASSDLDEGFADESGRIQDEARSEILNTRPSPRKEMDRKRHGNHHDHHDRRRQGRRSRSLVGYTPDHSFQRDNDQEDDLSSFIPPIRTSTPIFAQTSAYHKAYAESRNLQGGLVDPPAYTVSDVSQDLVEQTTEDFSALGLVTPTGKNAQLPNDYNATATWVDRIDDVPEHVRRRLEERADEFYEMGLMGRCWDMWFKTSEFYRVTYKNIPVARNNLLLRQVLEKWSRATRYQLSLPNTADKHRTHHLKSLVLQQWINKLKERQLDVIERRWTEEKNKEKMDGIWREWKDKAERKRTERWKVDMAEREIRFSDKRNQRILRESLLYWRVEARSRLADTDARHRQLGEVFYEWYDLASQQRELGFRLRNLEKKKAAQIFNLWRRRALHAPLERQMAQRQHQGLIRRVWDDWRISSWQKQQSSTFDTRRLLLMGLDGWRARYRQTKTLERKAKIYDTTRLVDTAFKVWKLESWGRLLLQTREKRLRERSWLKWKEGMARVDNIEALGDKFILQSNFNRIQTLFSHWRSLAASHQTAHLRARLIHEQSLKVSALAKWQASTATIRGNVIMADKAHAFFLLRTAFRVWRGESAKIKARRWVEQKQYQLVKRVFEGWRGLTARYQDFDRRERMIKDSINKRTLGRLLNRWTERVIEVKDREIRVARASDERLTHNAMTKWQDRLAIVQANKKKANDSLEIRELENLRRVFRFWRGRMKREKRLRTMVDTYVVERERRIITGLFGKWYERKRERELEEIENEVAFLHENVILYGVMDRWKAATEILPGIMADSARLKRRYIGIWFTALERKRKAKQLQQDRNSRLLSEAFTLWREAATYKSTLRVRRTRNRSRPSVGATATSEDPRMPSSRQRIVSHSSLNSTTRRIPSTSTSTSTSSSNFVSSDGHVHRRISGSRSPGLGLLGEHQGPAPGLGPGRYGTQYQYQQKQRSETVFSEPVYSRLRSELADKDRGNGDRRRRGGSEEVDDRASAAVAAGRIPDHRQDMRPRRWSRDFGESNANPNTNTNTKQGRYPRHLSLAQADKTNGDEDEGHDRREAEALGAEPSVQARSGSEMLRALRGSMPGR
ncbi:hypothetical protein IAT40_007871 [Kwoniella sp. CBS 6097]